MPIIKRKQKEKLEQGLMLFQPTRNALLNVMKVKSNPKMPNTIDKNARDINKCPECGSKNFTKSWKLEKEHTYENGKVVSRRNTSADSWGYFSCNDCGWEKISVP